MDQQKYFADLAQALITGGMSEAQSKAYCKRLATSLESLDEKTRQEKLSGYGNPDVLAKRVLSIAGKSKPTPAVQTPEPAATDTPAQALEHTINVDSKSTIQHNEVTRAVPTVPGTQDPPASTPTIDDTLQATRKKLPPVQHVTEPEEKEKKPISKRGMYIFWSSAIASSPLTVLLGSALAGLFAFAYAALIFIAVAMFVAVTATVIVGILLSVICIGYGIVMMLPGTEAFFVGLYEFGLGMIVVGATIVFPILEYNCATVLVPYTLKKLTVFLKFTILQIKRLGIYLYDLCRNL